MQAQLEHANTELAAKLEKASKELQAHQAAASLGNSTCAEKIGLRDRSLQAPTLRPALATLQTHNSVRTALVCPLAIPMSLWQLVHVMAIAPWTTSRNCFFTARGTPDEARQQLPWQLTFPC